MVLKAFTSDEDSAESEIVALKTSDSLDNVIRFYKNITLSDSWEKILQLRTEDNGLIVLWDRNGESAQILKGSDDCKLHFSSTHFLPKIIAKNTHPANDYQLSLDLVPFSSPTLTFVSF